MGLSFLNQLYKEIFYEIFTCYVKHFTSCIFVLSSLLFIVCRSTFILIVLSFQFCNCFSDIYLKVTITGIFIGQCKSFHLSCTYNDGTQLVSVNIKEYAYRKNMYHISTDIYFSIFQILTLFQAITEYSQASSSSLRLQEGLWENTICKLIDHLLYVKYCAKNTALILLRNHSTIVREVIDSIVTHIMLQKQK